MRVSGAGRPDGARLVASVIVPSCNRSGQLKLCLEALARQTHHAYEVVVIDDASNDDTALMVKDVQHAHADLSLHYLRNERNLGANPSRNRGVATARGEFVAFLDSDCVAAADWLERLMSGFLDERVAAVTGLVDDTPPRNIYELSFRGTHRVHQRGPAPRLIAGNMCVRKRVLRELALDEDRARQEDGPPDLEVSGRGDEEGLFLMIRAAGLSVMAVPDAVVLHDHRYTRRSYFKQAFRSGRAAARLAYKYHLPPRLDLLPFILGYLTLPLMVWQRPLAAVPLALFAFGCAAIAGNEWLRKGKSVVETIYIFPLQLTYYQVRLFGYVRETLRLFLTANEIVRVRLVNQELKRRA